MENNPKHVESNDEEGSAKKADEETEKNKEKLGKATGCERKRKQQMENGMGHTASGQDIERT